jgi:hypothetical protein
MTSSSSEEEVPPEVAARNLAALREADRPWDAAAFAYGAGVVPVVIANIFGLPILAALAANVAGAAIAAWRASTRPLARAAYVIPALVFSLGISIACLLYLSDGPAHVEISELFLPCILGGIPGAFLWWFVTKLFERKRP